MAYHKINKQDCLSVATPAETDRLNNITDYDLLKRLATRWCVANYFILGGYLGQDNWDATSRLTGEG